MTSDSVNLLSIQIKALGEELGLCELGFFLLDEPCGSMSHGISIAVPLSTAVVAEVADGLCPTHSYFHHYRTVNAYLDSCMLRLGLLLGARGWRYIPVGASQSIPTANDPHGYHGRFSHKQGACLAGLGYMGSSGLFLHSVHGPRVRLGTLLTDAPLISQNPAPVVNTTCTGCMLCRSACPAAAIRGVVYEAGIPEYSLVDPAACSKHMKQAYQLIGRGSVCGICMAVCPAGR